jgi:quercetin dioxygenase-like cupin family protein
MQDDFPGGRRILDSGAYMGGNADSELRWMGQTRTLFLATGATTQDGFALVDETAVRGEEIPLHRHPDDDESFYVLDGEITFFVDGQPGITARPGTFLHVPGGTVHGFRIASDTARYLILTTARHGEFYRAISVPARADGLPDSHDVDWDRVMATAQAFGIEVMGELPAD